MSASSRAAIREYAPAKINLTLRVLGRRRDGYHDLESLVAFVRLCDRLSLEPGQPLTLKVSGPFAAKTGALSGNLVLKAARLLSSEIKGLTLGRFALVKNLPAAAGIGGGSADAAAALRLLARANRLRMNDPRIRAVALKIGADVPVCLDPRPRVMRGIGEVLSDPVRIPKLSLVLVNPGKTLATERVFARYDLSSSAPNPESRVPLIPQWRSAFIATLSNQQNDLETPAIALAPDIAKVLKALRESSGCHVARMSGSGATCFGLFSSSRTAASATRRIKAAHPRWWVKASMLL